MNFKRENKWKKPQCEICKKCYFCEVQIYEYKILFINYFMMIFSWFFDDAETDTVQILNKYCSWTHTYKMAWEW